MEEYPEKKNGSSEYAQAYNVMCERYVMCTVNFWAMPSSTKQ